MVNISDIFGIIAFAFFSIATFIGMIHMSVFEIISIIILLVTAFIGWRVYLFGKEKISPDICVYLTITRDSKSKEEIHGFWNLTIKNFGLTTAYDIKLEIEPDVEFYCSPKGKIRLSEHSTIKGISYLVSNDERTIFIGSQFSGKKSYIPFETTFNVFVSFKNKRNSRYENKFVIDFNHLRDIVWTTKS